jgi:hypothetical protein
MRNASASILVILASICMAFMGTNDTFGWFLIVPVSLSSAALALAIADLVASEGLRRNNGSVRLHFSGSDTASQYLGRASRLRVRDARVLDN